MKKHDAIFLAGLILLSTIISFVLVLFGMNVILAGAQSQVPLFAYVTAAYGLGNVAILSLAWSSRIAWATSVNGMFALSYFGAFIIDSVNAGNLGAKGFVGTLVLATVLLFNWYAVKKVVERN